ncbi:MAG: SprT family zinc-dependent metalloprotease [Actinomycetaceae bacterium]|nr:SprT family zinc-dependent metalloprotease [Actinomycetaceae bacterium]
MSQAADTSHMRIAGYAIAVIRKSQKNLYLRVKKGKIVVTAPRHVTDSEIVEFVESKSAWIARHISSYSQRNDEWKTWALHPGETTRIFGRPRTLRPLHTDRGEIDSDNRPPYRQWELKSNELAIVNAHRLEQTAMRKLLSEILREEIDGLLNHWIPLIGRAPSRLVIRPMVSRWGSCRKVSRAITMNLYLVHLDRSYIEYVLVHELTHLHVAGHGREFYSRMDHYLPQWKILRRELNTFILA